MSLAHFSKNRRFSRALRRAHAVYLVADPCRADRVLREKARHRVLIFCRKPGERFRVGEDVVVTVERVRGQRVWLSFEAPAAVRIERVETHEPQATQPPTPDCPPLARLIRRVLSPAV